MKDQGVFHAPEISIAIKREEFDPFVKCHLPEEIQYQVSVVTFDIALSPLRTP
jgi:hypothetical protein